MMFMKEKLKKIFTLKNISLFLNILLFISLVLFFVNVFSINILPIKYAVEFLIIFVLINMIFVLVDLKFYKKKALIIILDIVCILLMALFIFGTLKIVETNSFFNRNSSEKVEITNYYVVVRKNSDYDTPEISRMTSPAMIRPATLGTKATLPGRARRPSGSSSSKPSNLEGMGSSSE